MQNFEINEKVAEKAHSYYSPLPYKKDFETELYKYDIDKFIRLADSIENIYDNDIEERKRKCVFFYSRNLARWINKYNRAISKFKSPFVFGMRKSIKEKMENQKQIMTDLWLEYINKVHSYIKRIKLLERYKPRPIKQGKADYSYDFTNNFGMEVIQNEEANRVQLKFNEPLTDELKDILKSHGWHFTHEKFFQRVLTDNALKNVLEIIKVGNNE